MTPLSEDERAQLSVRADEFHAALQRGAAADWEQFLRGLPDRVRSAVLNELVVVDLNYRWERKERPEIEDYVARLPEFGPIDRVPPSAIVEEYRCRRKAGERYEVERYRTRFPVQFPLVEKELNGMLEAAGTVPDTVMGTLVGAPHFPKRGPIHSPGSVAEEYDFIRVLGRGVFGEVWLAKKKTSGIDKAIKIVTQPPERDATKRELRSLELIKNLRHPYLLCTEDFWVGDGRLHIVMELAECTLRNRLERCREENLPGIPETELIGYIREAAEGLDFLHSRHVVHRDVKPDNILILNGHAKVADFGLAWQQDKLLAPMKTFAGTPAYMAPEVWGKEGGPASDLYSLAVTYAELRQGHPPLKSQQIEEMMLAHLGGSHDFEPPIRDEERPVLAKALARAPEDRYSSCMDFVEALSGALGMSFQPRSSAFSESKARLHSQGSDARKLDSRPQLATSVASHGTLLPRSDLQSPLETRAGRSTLGDAAKPPLPSPAVIAVRTPRARFKALLAAVLTLALIATAAAIAAFFWKNGKVQHPSISGAEEPVATPPTKAVTPPAQSIPTIPTRQTLPPPPPDRTILPPRAQRDPNSQIEVLADDRRVYDWISIPVGSEIVRFRLIGGGQAPKPTPPFYVMESKVWNQLLRSAGKAPPIGSEANGPFAPVTNLTFEQAAAFAREAFDGRLPSALEWDLAAGLYAGLAREEVTRAGGSPRVALAKPEPTAGANAGTDIDHFGLRDMAGNGREWTRTLFGPAGEREIDSAPLAAADRIVLRGRSFTLSRGLTFEMLRYEQAVPQTQFANAPSPYTSFRVAIPVPTK